MRTNTLLVFFPIVLLYAVIAATDWFARWSHTILGRIVAIILIVVYSKIDWLYGLAVCALVIFFYQTDYVESFSNRVEGFDAVAEFRGEHCTNGTLMNKGQQVRTEMAQHVFPEVINEQGCSICDTTCPVKIIETRLKNEDELLHKRNSNDWIDIVWDMMTKKNEKR